MHGPLNVKLFLIIAQKAGCVPEPVCTGVEKTISCPTGIEVLDHPAHSE